MAFAPLGPWNRGDVLDLHIFILLLIWFSLDRSNIYFSDVIRFWKQRIAPALFEVFAFWSNK